MTVKGLIKSIDYTGNTCTVRIPTFESAANDSEVCLPANIAMTPGLYNNYKEGDVVYVAFENNQLESPIVIGKLFLGTATEQKDPRGALNCDTIYSSTPISIPIDTKLTLNNDPKGLTTVGVDGDLTGYKSIADVVKGLQRQEKEIGSINAELIDDGTGLGARVSKLEDDDARHEAELIIHADEIENKVLHKTGALTEGFGWDLTDSSWSLNAIYEDEQIPIFFANGEGVQIAGNLKITGYPEAYYRKYSWVNQQAWADAGHVDFNPSTGYIESIDQPLHSTLAECEDTSIWHENYPDDTQYNPETDYCWQLDYAKTYYFDTTTQRLKPTITDVSCSILNEDGQPMRDIPSRRPTTSTGAATAQRALSIAQGKSTNYYGSADPRTAAGGSHTVENGDCWFDTSYHSVTSNDTPSTDLNNDHTFKTKEAYIGYFIETADTTTYPNGYRLVTTDNYATLVTANSTIAYTTGKLKQWSDLAANWIDIGGELVTNKLTANYINALNITAKKITIYQDGDETKQVLFKANGLPGESDSNKVTIGGFEVDGENLASTTLDIAPTHVQLTADTTNNISLEVDPTEHLPAILMSKNGIIADSAKKTGFKFTGDSETKDLHYFISIENFFNYDTATTPLVEVRENEQYAVPCKVTIYADAERTVKARLAAAVEDSYQYNFNNEFESPSWVTISFPKNFSEGILWGVLPSGVHPRGDNEYGDLRGNIEAHFPMWSGSPNYEWLYAGAIKNTELYAYDAEIVSNTTYSFGSILPIGAGKTYKIGHNFDITNLITVSCQYTTISATGSGKTVNDGCLWKETNSENLFISEQRDITLADTKFYPIRYDSDTNKYIITDSWAYWALEYPPQPNNLLGGPSSRWTAVYAEEIYDQSGIIGTSDRKLKNNITYDLTKYDAFFDSLRPASFKFNDSSSGRTHLGFIAQDIQDSLFINNLTRKDFGGIVLFGNGYDKKTDSIISEIQTTYGLRYEELHAIEVYEIQKLKKRVHELESIILQMQINKSLVVEVPSTEDDSDSDNN